MKIKTFKVPCQLKRGSGGEVELKIDDSKKELVGQEDVQGTQEIVTISKRLSDENENAKTVLKQTLFASEQESSTFIMFKYLSE
jgi:hypothetical protein